MRFTPKVLAALIICLLATNAPLGQTWSEWLDSAAIQAGDQHNLDSAIVLDRLALLAVDSTVVLFDSALAKVYERLGLHYYGKADFESAIEPWLKTDSIRVILLGADHVDLALGWHSVGHAYRNLGRLREAESCYRKAMAIREKALGPDHYLVALNILNLAILAIDQGVHVRAETLSRQALAILIASEGADGEQTAKGHDALARSLGGQGKHDEAEAHYLKAYAIRTATLGEEHRYAANTLADLAGTYAAQEKYELAERSLRQALEVVERWHEWEHPNVADLANRLANLCFAMGKVSEAEALWNRALRIWQKEIGATFPGVGEVLESFSRLERRRRNYALAFAHSEQAVAIRRQNFLDNSLALSEREALTHSRLLRKSVDNYLSCFADLARSTPQDERQVANVVFRTKGQVTDGASYRQQILSHMHEPQIDSIIKTLRQSGWQLAEMYARGPNKAQNGYASTLDSIQSKVDQQEALLARSSQHYRELQQDQAIRSASLASVLPQDACLVEYLQYDYQEIGTESTVSRYLAIVLDPQNEPRVVELGSARVIDSVTGDYRRHLMEMSHLGRLPLEPETITYRRLATTLYEMIWQPFDTLIANYDEVFVAPDGALNLVSFASLPLPGGKYLIERNELHNLSSARSLLHRGRSTSPSSGLLAFGDPDFNASVEDRARNLPAELVVAGSKPYSYDLRSGCGLLSDMVMSPLPGSRREVEAIRRAWSDGGAESVEFFVGAQASEEQFKLRSQGSRVVHLATHGYFLEGDCQSGQTEVAAIGSSSVTYNPLLQSGLFLAGANLMGAGAEQAGVDDGILTAYEVSTLDLAGVDLVVLSACETALGRVEAGEGVYGLRRAFQMAGARSVVSALWLVPDKVAEDLMTGLYKNLGSSVSATVRTTQLDQIHALRAAGKSDHPFSWAVFIAQGE